MLKEFLLSLSPETQENLVCAGCTIMLENNLYCFEGADTGLCGFDFEIRTVDGELALSEKWSSVLTEEEFREGKKVAALSRKRFDENETTAEVLYLTDGNIITSYTRTLSDGEKYITINGEKYEIRILDSSLDKPRNYTYKDDEIDITDRAFIPLTSLPDDLELNMLLEDTPILLNLNKAVTRSQYNDIQSCLADATQNRAALPPVEFTEVGEIYYYRTVLLISVVIAVLTAINMAILYRYILQRRSSDLAVMRICGCSKVRAIVMYLTECMLVNIPLFALTEIFYHKLIMPRLAKVFENMAGAYSFKIYAAVFLIYLAASLVVMLVMITAVISNHSLAELKSKHRNSRFIIMKVFEVCQLSSVFVLIVMICSTILSRYALYAPFKDVLESKGYMVYSYGSGLVTPEFMKKVIPNAKIYNTCIGGFYIESDNKQIDTITYCEELIDRYSPELSEGIWLSENKDSYADTGLMPVVVDAKCRYNIGEIVIIPDYEKNWDENGQPTETGDIKLKIIGRLKDNVPVVSYPDYVNAPVDYRNIYGVLHSEFEDNDFMLMRTEDMHSFTGRYTPLIGNQFVICDEMSDAEYEQVGRIISDELGCTYTPFNRLNFASLEYIYSQMNTLFPIALCIFILTVISSVSISAIHTKRQLHNYAIFYICGAKWRSCALLSLKASLMTCGASTVIMAVFLIVGRLTFMKETIITFGVTAFLVCLGVTILYLALSMIMPLVIIRSTQPREILKEE